MIHLCVVNHCGEEATFYLSEPNPDHMATPSPAHSFSSPPLSSFSGSPLGLYTPSSPSLFLPPLSFTHSSSVHPFSSALFAKKLPPCLLPLAILQHVCMPSSVCVCVSVCVNLCVLGRRGQAFLAVSYNQPSRVPVMLCIVRTHHERSI